MLKTRLSHDRGHAQHGWLESFHTFSFAGYHDPTFTGFRFLRVINEDRVQPNSGFGKHRHENMEILTYVLAGELEHRDSLGSRGVIAPGDVQLMTAGTGVLHSEVNPSPNKPVHFLQIWIFPTEQNLAPGYSQKHFSLSDKLNRLCLIAAAVSRPDRVDALKINQKVDLYAAILEPQKEIRHPIKISAAVWMQIIRGKLVVNNVALAAGDAVAVENEGELHIVAVETCEFLLFEMF